MSAYFREAMKTNTVLSTAGCDVFLHLFMEKSEAVILQEVAKFVFLHSETIPCSLFSRDFFFPQFNQ